MDEKLLDERLLLAKARIKEIPEELSGVTANDACDYLGFFISKSKYISYVDDWTLAVTSIPVSIPVMRLVVIAPRTWRNCGPAIFCNASLIDFIPYISKANEPNNVKNTQIDIYYCI